MNENLKNWIKLLTPILISFVIALMSSFVVLCVLAIFKIDDISVAYGLQNIIGIPLQLLLTTIIFYFYGKKFIPNFKDNLKGDPMDPKLLTFFVGLIISIVVALMGLVMLYSVKQNIDMLANNSPYDTNNTFVIVGMIIYIIAGVFIAPFIEEMAYRICIMDVARNLFLTTRTTILVPSTIFAFAHYLGSNSQIVSTFILALLLNFIYYKTSNVKYTIFVHAAWNLALILGIFIFYLPNTIITSMILIILGIVGITISIIIGKDSFIKNIVKANPIM